MCENVFVINNGIMVLTFHVQDLTKDCGRGLHGPEPEERPVPNPFRDFSKGLSRQLRGDFSNSRQMKGDIFNGPSKKK